MRIGSIAASLVLASGLMLATPVKADPRSDAEAIVSQLVTQEMIDVSVAAIQPLFRQALMGDLSKGEAAQMTPAAREKIISLFLDELRVRFLASLRGEMVRIYMEELRPNELADFKAFLATPSGKAFASKQPALVRRGSQAGEMAGRSIGPLAAQSIGQRLKAEGGILIPNPTDLAILRKLFPAR